MRQVARYGSPLLGIGVFLGAWLSADGLGSFVHPPSLLLTVGGTALVTLLSFPRHKLRALGAAVREAASAGQPLRAEIDQVKALAQRYRVDGITGLETLAGNIANPFLHRGIRLLLEWKRPEELRATLEAEHLRLVTHYEDCRRILLTIGKLLPAFGLIGTLVSLVLLLRHPAALTTDQLGPSLSLAILTTLYGAVLANAVVLPFEAKLQTFIDHLRFRFEVGLRASQLIADQAYPSLIEEQLACFVGTEEGPHVADVPQEPALAHAGAR
jgi:chemotaxis protein MotA